jgi:hypothetical protein
MRTCWLRQSCCASNRNNHRASLQPHRLSRTAKNAHGGVGPVSCQVTVARRISACQQSTGYLGHYYDVC